MAANKDSKARMLESLGESIKDEVSGLTIAVQQLHEAFDAFNQTDNQTEKDAIRVSECLHEVWVQVTQAFARAL